MHCLALYKVHYHYIWSTCSRSLLHNEINWLFGPISLQSNSLKLLKCHKYLLIIAKTLLVRTWVTVQPLWLRRQQDKIPSLLPYTLQKTTKGLWVFHHNATRLPVFFAACHLSHTDLAWLSPWAFCNMLVGKNPYQCGEAMWQLYPFSHDKCLWSVFRHRVSSLRELRNRLLVHKSGANKLLQPIGWCDGSMTRYMRLFLTTRFSIQRVYLPLTSYYYRH